MDTLDLNSPEEDQFWKNSREKFNSRMDRIIKQYEEIAKSDNLLEFDMVDGKVSDQTGRVVDGVSLPVFGKAVAETFSMDDVKQIMARQDELIHHESNDESDGGSGIIYLGSEDEKDIGGQLSDEDSSSFHWHNSEINNNEISLLLEEDSEDIIDVPQTSTSSLKANSIDTPRKFSNISTEGLRRSGRKRKHVSYVDFFKICSKTKDKEEPGPSKDESVPGSVSSLKTQRYHKQGGSSVLSELPSGGSISELRTKRKKKIQKNRKQPVMETPPADLPSVLESEDEDFQPKKMRRKSRCGYASVMTSSDNESHSQPSHAQSAPAKFPSDQQPNMTMTNSLNKAVARARKQSYRSLGLKNNQNSKFPNSNDTSTPNHMVTSKNFQNINKTVSPVGKNPTPLTSNPSKVSSSSKYSPPLGNDRYDYENNFNESTSDNSDCSTDPTVETSSGCLGNKHKIQQSVPRAHFPSNSPALTFHRRITPKMIGKSQTLSMRRKSKCKKNHLLKNDAESRCRNDITWANEESCLALARTPTDATHSANFFNAPFRETECNSSGHSSRQSASENHLSVYNCDRTNSNYLRLPDPDICRRTVCPTFIDDCSLGCHSYKNILKGKNQVFYSGASTLPKYELQPLTARSVTEPHLCLHNHAVDCITQPPELTYKQRKWLEYISVIHGQDSAAADFPPKSVTESHDSESNRSADYNNYGPVVSTESYQ